MVKKDIAIQRKPTSSLVSPTYTSLTSSGGVGRTRLVGFFAFVGLLGSLLILTVLPGLLIFIIPGQIYLAGKAYDGITCGKDPEPYCPACPMTKPVRELAELTTDSDRTSVEHRGHYPYTA
ncbi:MAG: hypothetical protein ACFFE6_03180 [Candidatus Thorarchaeota archaeon]